MFPFFKTEEMKYLESQTPGQHAIHNIYNEYHNDVTNILFLISDYFGKNTKFCKNIRELFVIHCMNRSNEKAEHSMYIRNIYRFFSKRKPRNSYSI